MLTMLATLCHMATVGTAQIEFCQEQVIAHNESSDVNSCYVAAQQMIAPRLMPGYTVKEVRCIKGDEKPRNAI